MRVTGTVANPQAFPPVRRVCKQCGTAIREPRFQYCPESTCRERRKLLRTIGLLP